MEESTSLKKRRSIIALFFAALTWLVPASICYIILHSLAAKGLAPVSSNLAAITFFYRTVCIVVLLEMTRLYFNSLYTFGDTRIINSSGLISLAAKRTSITYEDVRDVGIKQSLLGRIFDYGTVELGTAALDAHEIEFQDVNNPNAVANYVRERMNAFKKEIESESEYVTNDE